MNATLYSPEDVMTISIYSIFLKSLKQSSSLLIILMTPIIASAGADTHKLKHSEELSSKLSSMKIISEGVSSNIPLSSSNLQISSNNFTTAKNALESRIKMRGASDTILFTKASPAVVLIVASDGAIGSGSIINDEGDILTNWHVVANNTEVGVFFKPDNFEEHNPDDQYIADVIKIDQISDLAIIRLRHKPDNFIKLELADKKDIDVAMDVHAIGHPQGQVWSYTKGLVSQIRPNYKWQSGTERAIENHVGDIIQTQTPINPGNSGGPLLNDSGKIVGVNSFIAQGADGMNYAVAVTEINRFLSQDGNRYFESHSDSGHTQIKAFGMEGGKELDLDDDGKTDAYGFDRNNNGKLDTFIVDLNNDGEGDLILVDSNENGQPDIEISEELYNGRTVYMWYIDEDEDGYADLQGIDYDQDGEPDQIIRT